VKKTTRQIYVDLVKHCHPDREQDELKRIEKTEWMKQITAAYEWTITWGSWKCR